MYIIIIIHGEAADANLLVCFVRVHQLWFDRLTVGVTR